MSGLLIPGSVLPATTGEALEKVDAVDRRIREMPQISVQTEHILHAGMYSRTIRLDAGVVIVSVLIKIPTVLIVNGSARVFAGEQSYDLEGYNVMPASAGRKMIYVTKTETAITMVFPTTAKTVDEAEREFTDDPDLLLSRHQEEGRDLVIITGA